MPPLPRLAHLPGRWCSTQPRDRTMLTVDPNVCCNHGAETQTTYKKHTKITTGDPYGYVYNGYDPGNEAGASDFFCMPGAHACLLVARYVHCPWVLSTLRTVLVGKSCCMCIVGNNLGAGGNPLLSNPTLFKYRPTRVTCNLPSRNCVCVCVCVCARVLPNTTRRPFTAAGQLL